MGSDQGNGEGEPTRGDIDLDAQIESLKLDKINSVKKMIREHHTLCLCILKDDSLQWMSLPADHAARTAYKSALSSQPQPELHDGMVLVTQQNHNTFFTSPFVFDRSYDEAMPVIVSEEKSRVSVPLIEAVAPKDIVERLGIPERFRKHKWLYENCDGLQQEGRDKIIRYLRGKYVPTAAESDVIVLRVINATDESQRTSRRVFQMFEAGGKSRHKIVTQYIQSA